MSAGSDTNKNQPIRMNKDKLIRGAIGAVVIALAALIAVKPNVPTEFHSRYLSNIDTLDSLSDTLIRNHLLVRNGIVNHYDDLEATLLKMERSANLAALPPEHVGNAFEETAKSLSTDYLSDIQEVRQLVNVSKRSIGLLKNSNKALSVAVSEISAMALDPGAQQSGSQLQPLVIQFKQILASDNNQQAVSEVLDKLRNANTPETLLARLALHSGLLDSYQPPLLVASDKMYELVDSLKQPDELRLAYKARHNATLQRSEWALWASYALALFLVVLALLLAAIGDKARNMAELALAESASSKKEVEQKVEDTRQAVTRCNEVLQKISQGDFTARVADTFSDELEHLKSGINGAADSIEFTMQELQRIMHAMTCGNFTVELDHRVKGNLRDQVAQTNSSLQFTMDSIGSIMENMMNGNFSERIELELEGSFETLKNTVNSSQQSLEKSLAEITNVVHNQAEGDFTQRINGEWPGELGALSESINSTSRAVEDMVKGIQILSKEVAGSSQVVMKNAENLQSKFAIQNQSIDDAKTAAQAVGTLIVKNNESTNSASELARNSEKKTTECQQISASATVAMKSIIDRTTEICGITKTIRSIASKTNLLSLNAAVEAARAREHGKGFTVVAEEVRSLAKMTAAASTSIEKLITETNKQVAVGSDSVTHTAKALENIETSISDVNELSLQISNASSTQLEELENMSTRVNEALSMTHESEALAAESVLQSQSLDLLANQMAKKIEFFKVGQPA